jgi:hypothetical protein
LAEIFLNYRHQDGHATGRLGDRLNDRLNDLGAFIDIDMQSGDSISRKIQSALADTRVFLAVIGKEWMKPENLARLHNENDWIRRELLQVLDREEVRVVPVLVDDEIEMPTAEMLPTALRSFADRRDERLSYESWAKDVDKLIESIHQWLAVPAAVRRPGPPMPADIPYLCDRAEQEYDLSQLAPEIRRTRSLVCVLHGHKWEAHAKFLRRLDQLGLLSKLFDAGDAGVGESPIQWNDALARAGKFGDMLRYYIKSDVMKNPVAEDADLFAYLRNAVRPLVLTLQVTWPDLQKCAPTALGDIQRAWTDLMAALGALPTHALILWVNVTYDDDSQPTMPTLGIPALTRLAPVTEGHIQSWLNRDEVRRFVGERTTDILKLTNNARFYIEPGKLHMQRFADAVRELIAY